MNGRFQYGFSLSSHDHGLTVKRDAGFAALLGPIQLVTTTLGTLILYRIVLSRGGLEVIGVFSLLNVLSSLIWLVDVGFSQILTREMHGRNGTGVSDQTTESLLDKCAAEHVYRCFLWFAAIPSVLLAAWLLPGIPYDRVRFAGVLVLIAWSSVMQLEGKLEAAILAACQDNVHVQLVSTGSTGLFLAVSIIGASLDTPIEGFAVGTLLSAALALFLFRRRAASHGMVKPIDSPASLDLFKRAWALAGRGGYFYLISLGRILREPVFRAAIGCLLGVKALGVYAIAFRASAATRDLAAGGFNVLYPAMASLYKAGNRADIESMQRASMIFLTVFGGAALGCLYGFAEPVLYLFLGSLPEGVVDATRILIVWNLMTLLDLPFYYLLQATGHEKVIAVSLWVHTVASLLLWPLQLLTHLTLGNVLLYWTATSLVSEGVAIYYLEKELAAFWPVLKARSVSVVLLFALLYFAVILKWVSLVHEPAGAFDQFIDLAKMIFPATLLFITSAICVSRDALWKYWSRSS